MIDPKDEKDYQDFLNSKGFTPAKNIDNIILDFVRNDLNFNVKDVFFKLVIVQAFIGFMTLLFCPQFNLSLTNNYELFHYFHHNYGENICMVICGSIFMGTGAIFASTLLERKEVDLIRSKEFLLYPALSILALPFFLIFGAELYFNLTLFWLLGAAFGGILLFEITFKVKELLVIKY